MSFLSLFGSDSQSSSSTSQSTTTTDQRVGQDGSNNIAVGQSGSYVNNIAPQTVDIIKNISDFAGSVLNKVVGITDSAVMNNATVAQQAVSAQTQSVAQAQLGNASIISQNIPLIAVAAAVVAIFYFNRKS